MIFTYKRNYEKRLDRRSDVDRTLSINWYKENQKI